MSELSKKFIERQNWFSYYGINTSDVALNALEKYDEEQGISYSKILKFLAQEDESTLSQFSIPNLMKIMFLYNLSEEAHDKIQKIISDKMDNNETFYTEESMYGTSLNQISTAKLELNSLDKSLSDRIKNDILERREAVRGTNCAKIMEHIFLYTDISNFLVYFEQGVFTDEKVQFMEEILEENTEALKYTNFCVFKDEIYKRFNKDFIKYAIKFPDICLQLDILSQENPELLQLVADKANDGTDLRDNINLLNHMIRYATKHCYDINIGEITEENLRKFVDSALRNNKSTRDDLIIHIPYSNNYETDLEELFKEEYKLAMEYFAKKEEESAKKEYHDIDAIVMPEILPKYEVISNYKGKTFRCFGDSKNMVLKNIYLNKYFSMSLKEAESIIEMYGQDIEKINAPEGKQLIKRLKEIIELEDVDQLDFSLAHNENAEEIEKIKLEMEHEFALSYTDELTKTKEELTQTGAKTTIEFDGKKIIQIEPDENFSMLVHSTNAGFVNDNKVDEKGFKANWKNSSLNFNHIISMAYINQDFLGMAPVSDEGVIYGFASLEKESIKLMGNTDINTYSSDIGYNSKFKKYLTANSMPYNSRRVYSEVGVERKNANPDYVILFDDSTEEYKENAYKAAAEWDIPVVFIDKEKVKDRQIERLEQIRNDFEETKDISKLHELLNTYETNMAGWLLNRKKDEEDITYTKCINHERFRDDFEKEYEKITETMNNYLDSFDISKDDSKDLARAMLIVLEEHELYATADETRPISKTQSTIDTKTLIEKINNTMDRAGMSEYRVSPEEIPKKEKYEKKFMKLLKCGLKDKGISYEEVQMADRQLNKENVKENQLNLDEQ